MEGKACFHSNTVYKASIFWLRYTCQRSDCSQGSHSQNCVYISFSFNKAAIHNSNSYISYLLWGYMGSCWPPAGGLGMVLSAHKKGWALKPGIWREELLLLLVLWEERAGSQIPRAWLVCSSAEAQSDEMGLLWANLGALRYNSVFTAQHHKANK